MLTMNRGYKPQAAREVLHRKDEKTLLDIGLAG